MSQKKCANVIFCFLSVRYKPKYQQKLEETLNKTVQKMPTLSKMCASSTKKL